MADRTFRYCPNCRAGLAMVESGGRLRPTCSDCGFVQYLNPAPGAGVILWRDGKVCLVQRRFAPNVGKWTLPTGFMEWDEDIETTAVRETKEETGLDIELRGLFAVHTGILPPDTPVLVVFFDAQETGGELAAGDDAAAVGFFALDHLPGPIAFAAHRKVLRALGAAL
jgi:ADP-ribose pyrophosphatase YjhB (NUDIX family)